MQSYLEFFLIDSLKRSIDNTDYGNVLPACTFKKQNSKPTRKTATSTWIDHLITSCQIEYKKVKSKKSDPFAVLQEISGTEIASISIEPKTIIVRELKKKQKLIETFVSFGPEVDKTIS